MLCFRDLDDRADLPLAHHSLYKDDDNLANLREKLFTLWGDLEEHKVAKIQQQRDTIAKRKQIAMAPPPTDDTSDAEADIKSQNGMGVSNKPFTCCIQQYGIRVKEENPALANAGRNKRWERVYGLFGTKICS
jgi:hypothetical protein